jgi:hypothetical protein
MQNCIAGILIFAMSLIAFAMFNVAHSLKLVMHSVDVRYEPDTLTLILALPNLCNDAVQTQELDDSIVQRYGNSSSRCEV